MLVDDLRPVFLFDGLPDAELARLAEVGEDFSFAPGDVLFGQGKPAEAWWVLLEGRVELVRRAGREDTVVGAMERPGQWAGGFLAWTDAAGYMATGRATSEGRMFRVPSEAFGAWARSAFPLGGHLIAGFFQTVRNIEAIATQREALVALGTLAAGLAHEINNPASAVVRAVDSLREASERLSSSLADLCMRGISADRLRALDGLRREVRPTSGPTDAVALADREEAIGDWLEDHDVDDAWQLAPAMASAGVDLAWCEKVGELLDDELVGPGIAWVASTMTTNALLDEMTDATSRVSGLVAAVKSYSQLDRASFQAVDVAEGLESTLVMLSHELRDGVTVERDYATDLPRVEANAGELNQVWTNLIHNAVDAMGGKGTLRLSTRADGDTVVVEVADTGHGMTPEVQAHVFDPFFTTKGVGKGTGLGLDISRRIVVERHDGAITVESEPGHTVFTVRLPNRSDQKG